jgi:thioredoxin 1
VVSDTLPAVTRETFADEVLASPIPVLVDFWAEWCGPCKQLVPLLARIAEQHDGRLRVVQVNVEDQQELAVDYRVVGLPSLKVFVGGELVTSMSGRIEPAALDAQLTDVLSA